MTAERPLLEAVLDHYQARYNTTRSSQMVPCPLHDDRTPSCSINLEKQLWNCHSCGKSGDSYTLIMLKENINFVRARAFAATLGLAAGDAGGGDSQLSGSHYGGRRAVPARKGDRPANGSYKPSWRRS